MDKTHEKSQYREKKQKWEKKLPNILNSIENITSAVIGIRFLYGIDRRLYSVARLK